MKLFVESASGIYWLIFYGQLAIFFAADFDFSMMSVAVGFSQVDDHAMDFDDASVKDFYV